MKKNKSKSANPSGGKKVRKELVTKLAAAFNEVVSTYGKAKKTDKVIAKFAKQLAKKVTVAVANDAIEPFIKEDETVSPAKKEKAAKPVATKPVAKKVKATEKEEVESK